MLIECCYIIRLAGVSTSKLLLASSIMCINNWLINDLNGSWKARTMLTCLTTREEQRGRVSATMNAVICTVVYD